MAVLSMSRRVSTASHKAGRGVDSLSSKKAKIDGKILEAFSVKKKRFRNEI